MKRLLLLTLAFLLAQPLFAATDDEVAARKVVQELAGAFANDGFKLRDGNWTGAIQPKDALLIQVNLYAGNQYWFSVGATAPAKKLLVTVFDETGKPVEVNNYQNGSTAAAGFSPESSGSYYVRIQETEGEPASFCLIYSYK
ncbi:MAG: hypothetical protein WCH43_15730 [Verrucomicrobiota bacterium]